MEEGVVVTGLAIKAPGIGEIDDLIAPDRSERATAPVVHTFPGRVTTEIHNYALDENAPHYPTRKARKTMSPDSVAAVVCTGELLDAANLAGTDLTEVPFFVAAGPSLDSADADVAVEALEHAIDGNATPQEHFSLLFDGTHPLFALRVLSNAGSCHVAQRFGLTGDSTTFGTTSTDGFHALETAVDYVRTGRAPMAVVGVYNGSGPLTALSHWTLRRAGELWRESGACVFVLVESLSAARAREAAPLALIDKVVAPPMVPSVLSPMRPEPYAFMADEERSGSVVFSGGFCDADYEAERSVARALWDDTFSWYEALGTLGTASVLVSLATGVARIRAGEIEASDGIDRDLYGRETRVRVRRVAS